MFECIQVLSAYGADFTAVSKTGDTALHFATVAYRLLCIRLLGQRGKAFDVIVITYCTCTNEGLFYFLILIKLKVEHV